MKWRIAWRTVTGHTGHGEGCFDDRKAASEYAREANREHAGSVVHWIELCPEQTDTVAQ